MSHPVLPEIVLTEDGSPTLRFPGTHLTYHSMAGARSESIHVYLNASHFDALLKEGRVVRVLEVGFGTGLNFCLSAEAAAQYPHASLEFFSCEPHPLPSALLSQYYQHLSFPEALAQLAVQCTSGSWRNSVLHLTSTPWPEWTMPQPVDVVFYDAFAPSDAEVLWQQQALLAAMEALKPGGCLVTFSVTGAVKRLLREAGYIVERLRGFGGKRHMLRATRPTG